MPSSQDLTDTTARAVFPLARSNDSNVTLTFSTDPTRPAMVLFNIPTGSTWHPGLHWHESYTEYVYVRQGRCTVSLNGLLKTVTSEDGPQRIDKFVVHEWFRADRLSEIKDDEELIVEEWTDPADGIKQVFFRNLIGAMEDSGRYWRRWTRMQICLTSDAYDNYDLYLPPSVPQTVHYYYTHWLLTCYSLGARTLGLKPWYPAYTPENLRSVAAEVSGTNAKAKTL